MRILVIYHKTRFHQVESSWIMNNKCLYFVPFLKFLVWGPQRKLRSSMLLGVDDRFNSNHIYFFFSFLFFSFLFFPFLFLITFYVLSSDMILFLFLVMFLAMFYYLFNHVLSYIRRCSNMFFDDVLSCV